ncbi:hypothetical protein BLSTO_06445 [Blastocystis sp. subtype 1]
MSPLFYIVPLEARASQFHIHLLSLVLWTPCVRQFMSPILLSAETHTFPLGVAPFPGAETGTGSRIRDVQTMNEKVTASTVATRWAC